MSLLPRAKSRHMALCISPPGLDTIFPKKYAFPYINLAFLYYKTEGLIAVITKGKLCLSSREPVLSSASKLCVNPACTF